MYTGNKNVFKEQAVWFQPSFDDATEVLFARFPERVQDDLRALRQTAVKTGAERVGMIFNGYFRRTKKLGQELRAKPLYPLLRRSQMIARDTWDEDLLREGGVPYVHTGMLYVSGGTQFRVWLAVAYAASGNNMDRWYEGEVTGLSVQSAVGDAPEPTEPQMKPDDPATDRSSSDQYDVDHLQAMLVASDGANAVGTVHYENGKPSSLLVRCLWHDDKNPSMRLFAKNGHGACIVCQKTTTIVEYVAKLYKKSERNAFEHLTRERVARKNAEVTFVSDRAPNFPMHAVEAEPPKKPKQEPVSTFDDGTMVAFAVHQQHTTVLVAGLSLGVLRQLRARVTPGAEPAAMFDITKVKNGYETRGLYSSYIDRSKILAKDVPLPAPVKFDLAMDGTDKTTNAWRLLMDDGGSVILLGLPIDYGSYAILGNINDLLAAQEHALEGFVDDVRVSVEIKTNMKIQAVDTQHAWAQVREKWRGVLDTFGDLDGGPEITLKRA